MRDRRTHLLDTALEIIGTRGLRSLTHRAVDAAAQLPPGSTSNYFRSKDALLVALVERFADREREVWDALARGVGPATPKELAATLASHARASTTGRHRALTLARYALLVEGAQNPALQGRLAETGARVNSWFAQWLRAVGSTRPQRDLGVIANYVTGLVLHELAHPTADFDPTPQLLELLDTLMEAP